MVVIHVNKYLIKHFLCFVKHLYLHLWSEYPIHLTYHSIVHERQMDGIHIVTFLT